MLVFIPDKRGGNRLHLQQAGLTFLDRDGDPGISSTDLVSPGPGGKHGQIWGWIDEVAKKQVEPLAYHPDRQTWIEGPDGKYWVGWSHANEPSPATLRRAELIDGPMIELADGREWQIISAMRLPSQARLKDGRWQWGPQERFAAFVERSLWALDIAKNALLPGERVVMPIEAMDFAMEVLSWNYRITPEIVSRLGLFTPWTLFTTLATATNVAEIAKVEDELKKAGAAAPPSG